MRVTLWSGSNITKYPDSINSTFVFEYVANNLSALVVFANSIENVSITNSTNNTNFYTGILWDKSDDSGDGQFSGSEDIVFVTEIKRNQPGKFGDYDFEMRVPSLLPRYKQPNTT